MSNSNLFKENKIEYLTHFTSIYNLQSILKNGILSVDYMNKNNIVYSRTDKNRFDNQLDFISVSLNVINKKMLYKKIYNNKRLLNIWVILILDLTLLDTIDTDMYYCYKNASSSEIKTLLREDSKQLMDINKFLVSEDIQKEILIKERISVKYIKGIVVKDFNEKDIVNSLVVASGRNIPIICKREMF